MLRRAFSFAVFLFVFALLSTLPDMNHRSDAPPEVTVLEHVAPVIEIATLVAGEAVPIAPSVARSTSSVESTPSCDTHALQPACREGMWIFAEPMEFRANTRYRIRHALLHAPTHRLKRGLPRVT